MLDNSLYYNAFDRLAELEINKTLKIVIIIDDLDRCFPDSAIKLLEGIKLALAQPGFIFILGVARNIIEGYLEHRYKDEFGLENFQGSSYLDKIVQLPFYLPSHRDRMQNFLLSLIPQMAGLEELKGMNLEKYFQLLAPHPGITHARLSVLLIIFLLIEQLTIYW